MQVETSYDLRENIAALCIAILREDITIPEQAFSVIEGKPCKLTDEDTLDMIAMRSQGMHYREIGGIYGISSSGVLRRIDRHKKETNLDGSPKRSAI
mgnify:CR=1 FL=1